MVAILGTTDRDILGSLLLNELTLEDRRERVITGLKLTLERFPVERPPDLYYL